MRPRVALLSLLLCHAALASTPRLVDYVYVEANEGGSSGGHTALRFADETYHFQHEPPGVLRLRRDDWRQFRYAYGVLQNRTMHVSRIAVSEDDYTRLRQRFNEEYLGERSVFEHRDALRDDRTVLAVLLARRRGEDGAALRLRGAGFFFPEDPGAVPSPVAAALRQRVVAAYGPDGLRRRMADARRELAGLTVPEPGPAANDIPSDGFPAFAYPFSRRHRDLLTAVAAVEALERALPLRPDATWPPHDGLALDPVERRALAAYADRLAEDLVRLFRSARPDWGFAFLVGMARLEALGESVATGRLVLLDAFPPEPELVASSYLRRHRAAVAGLHEEARDELDRARARLHTGDAIAETDFTAVEAAGNRALELEAAAAAGRDLRVAGDFPVPSRDAAWPEPVVPAIAEADLRAALERATTAAERFDALVERRYRYDLVRRNCVSEVFHTVDAAGADPGGRIGTRWSLDFIPFVAAGAVDDRWNVVQRATLWSYRRSREDEMHAGLGVRLRESSVLSSTIYRRNPDDSFFLLFTDEFLALRPVFGAVNLVAGVGAAVVGLPLAVLDGGRTMLSGLRGALFSAPELVFVNLRKGSYDWVPPDERPVDAGWEIAARTP